MGLKSMRSGGKSGENKKPLRAINVLSLAIIPVLAAILIALGLVYLFMGDAQKQLAENRQANERSMLDAMSAQFSIVISERRQWLAQVVKEPELVNALTQTTSFEAHEKRLAVLFPGALKTRILPKGFAGRAETQVPPMGIAVKDMVNRAESSKSAPMVEVHFPGGSNEQVNFLQPVFNAQDEVIGHILITYPAGTFHELFAHYRMPFGYARLLYTAPDKKEFELTSRGDRSLLSKPCERLVQVQDSPLSICYISPPEISVIDTVSVEKLVLLLVIAAGLLLAAGLLPLMIVRRLIRHDGDIFVSILEDLRANELRHAYGVRISDLKPYLHHQYEIAVDMTEVAANISQSRSSRSRPAGGADEGDTAKSSASQNRKAQPELPPDTLSGIQVTEVVPPLKDMPVEDKSASSDTSSMPDAEKVTPPTSRHRQGGNVEDRGAPDIPSLFDGDGGDSSEDTGLLIIEPDSDPVDPLDFSMDFSESVELAAEIFRAYDIRGVVGKSLNAAVVNLLGKAVGTEAVNKGHNAIVVARDGRLSGPELLAALVDGLASTGLSVINIGEVPTPVMYFTTFALGTGAGVVLTGSHNPKDHNGMKIMLGGETLSGDAIQHIRKIAEAKKFAVGNGNVRQQNMQTDYLDRIAEDITLHRAMKVVIDCGNGVAGAIAPKLFKMLGCTVEELFTEVNGHFPNHHPDPSVPENLDAMISLVRLQKADIGIAFDGDGDRLGVVDCQGRIIWPDRQMMLFAKDVLSRNPGSDIIYDVKCSNKLAEVITDNAGVPVMWKTGHSLIKSKLKELNAPLAGEMSGHIFFGERWFGFDDAMYAAARLIEILSADNRPTSEIFAELPDSVSTPELKLHMQEGEPAQFMRNFLAKAKFSDAKITTIDGLRADFMDGWGLIRASNTTACLVLRFDADSSEALIRIQKLFKDQILAVDPQLTLPF